MTVPKYAAPLTNEQVKALIDRVLDYAMIEQDGDGARALITLIAAVAGEESADARGMIALDVTAAIYARSEAFWTAAKAFADGARAHYLVPDSRRRTRGKGHLSKNN